MPEKSENNKRKRIIVIVSIVSGLIFLVMPIIPLIGSLNNSSKSPSSSTQSSINKEAVAKQLQEKEQAYLAVLKRESNNPRVIQGLVETRIQLFQITGNTDYLQASIEPLDKLIQLAPPQDKPKLKQLKDSLPNIIKQEQARQQNKP